MCASSQVKLLLAQLIQVLLLVLKLKPAGFTVPMLKGPSGKDKTYMPRESKQES